MTAGSSTETLRPCAFHKGVLLLPRTAAGRALLRAVLPAAFSPDRSPGELPDGTSIYGCDFDASAEDADREYAKYERWCREQERRGR